MALLFDLAEIEPGDEISFKPEGFAKRVKGIVETVYTAGIKRGEMVVSYKGKEYRLDVTAAFKSKGRRKPSTASGNLSSAGCRP